MGLKLLTTTAGALVLIFFIDFFIDWYLKFLNKFNIDLRFKITILRLFWVIMALVFWYSLIRYGFPEKFGMPFLLFVLFIYSIRGLIVAFLKK